MNNFKYFAPTKVVFGKNTENEIGKLIKEQKCKKVLIHYGGSSAIKYGLIDRIKKSLDESDIQYIELGGVVPNPRLSLVYKGIELCKKENIDFIGHFHVADCPGRHEPGTGNVDYVSVLSEILKARYRGYIGLEYRATCPDRETFGFLEKIKNA